MWKCGVCVEVWCVCGSVCEVCVEVWYCACVLHVVVCVKGVS